MGKSGLSPIFDVAVIGLGATGAAAAWQLAKRGAKVLGIDRHSPPHAFGSSHGDTRITRLAIGEGERYTPLVLRANEIWRELEERSGEILRVVTGGLIVSSPARKATTHVPGFFGKTLAAARRFGIDHEILDAPAIRARFPQFAVRDNEVGYHEPGAGYLRPERCLAVQLALAQAAGAELHREEAVLRVEDDGDGVRVVTAKATYGAREAILAVGPWLPQMLEPALAGYFTVTRQVLYWFEPRAGIAPYEAPRFPVWIWELQDHRNVIYGFPAVDGAGGGVKLATEQYAHATTADAVDRTVTAGEIDAMHRDLVAPHFPGIGPRCVKAVACLYTATPDFHFVMDRHPSRRNVVIASPCSGHGFKHSAAVGEILAQTLAGERAIIDASTFILRA